VSTVFVAGVANAVASASGKLTLAGCGAPEVDVLYFWAMRTRSLKSTRPSPLKSPSAQVFPPVAL
jgi:hypothetical protein